MAEENDACAVAHGTVSATGPAPVPTASAAPAPTGSDRTLVAVFASPVSGYLLRYAADAGYRTLLVEDGFCRGRDAMALCRESGIWPDFIAPRL